MPQETLLCVDTSNILYRAMHANYRLTCDGVFTGGLYGFFMWLGKAVRETRATRLAFCLDSKPYLRSIEYPDYKRLRTAPKDPATVTMFSESKRLVLETLFSVGAPVYALEGFEADDFTAAIALRYQHRLKHIYAGGNDSDLCQLLWMDNFSIYKSDIANLITGHTLMRDHGLTPEQYMLATALQGTHNDVAGIPGVGPVTAIKAVTDEAKLRALRSKHADIIERNLRLIRLPHPKFPRHACMLDPQRGAFNPRDLYKALGLYDINCTEAMVQAFEKTGV